MKSTFGYKYLTKNMSVLNLEMTTIRDLDESIDILCEHFGEEDQDQSLAEEHCPYFGVMWEAGIGLSQFLTREMCEGKKILEIGCGLALPSFIATRFGGNVIATDFHADVPLFLQENQEKNKINFEYQVMNWRNEIERTKTSLGLFDLVIGSDILYESQHADQVAEALIAFLKPGGKILLSDPGRAYVQKFISAMQKLGYPEKFTTQKVPAHLTPKNIDREIYLFEFSK
ncbi:methyltransferase domain-containing protein [Bacteriovorax sp. PP10]|uniref:Methyltransferase domain-containing protein n=1 Tax=Bacteriovorax antarcticus TaxID=3088717 RepID=A0ABU5VSW6_9BACT|nr:methyltransferase domain-containing protein [Bacteriovorax sp. PP10]MEA9355478.1 methyltransferase domain-containing protein [Bacteriovorax sp. PP10]